MKVRYTRTCLPQTDAAVVDLGARNPQAARGLQERLLAVIALLQTRPNSARETGRRDIRRFPLCFDPYMPDYSADEDEIVLRRFRHTSRRPSHERWCLVSPAVMRARIEEALP